jgi:hypothetical protein
MVTALSVKFMVYAWPQSTKVKGKSQMGPAGGRGNLAAMIF